MVDGLDLVDSLLERYLGGRLRSGQRAAQEDDDKAQAKNPSMRHFKPPIFLLPAAIRSLSMVFAILSLILPVGADQSQWRQAVNQAGQSAAQGDSARAETLLKSALALSRRGEERFLVLRLLGELAASQGQLDSARAYLEEALSQGEAALGPGHPGLLLALDALGMVCAEQKDYPRAEQLLTRAVALVEQGPGGESATVPGLIRLGEVQQEAGHLREAEGSYRRALRIETRTGPGGLIQAGLDQRLGEVLRLQGRARESVAYFQRALSSYEKHVGPYDPALSGLLENYLKSLNELSEAREAREVERRLRELRSGRR